MSRGARLARAMSRAMSTAPESDLPHVVVFGGNGFIGSATCK